MVLSKALEIKNKRQNICCIILAVILSCAEVVGYNIQQHGSFIPSKMIFLKSGIKILGYTIAFYSLLSILFSWIDKENNQIDDNKVWKNGKKFFFISWIIIFLAYVPHLLQYFPGSVTKDPFEQICQVLGKVQLRDHHPMFHTFIIYIAMSIGKWINGTNQLGILIYSIGQMLFLSFTFAYIIYYMNKKKINKFITMLTLLFYALYPIHGNYSIVMWKDVPFAAMIGWYTIVIIELITNQNNFLSSKRKNVIFILIVMFMSLLRSNGIYIFVLTIPLVILYLKKNRKKLIIMSSICIVLYIIIKGPIYSMFNIEPASIKETLSIPLQQFARVIKYEENNLTEEEKVSIYKFFTTDNIGELYSPEISDPVKRKFSNQGFKENTGEFITIWVKLFFKYPKQYIDSFLANSCGYWYPEYKRNFYAEGIEQATINLVSADSKSKKVQLSPKEAVDIETKPIIQSTLLKNIYNITQKRDIPVLSMMFSIGFQFWMILTGVTYSIYNKKYKDILIFLPIIILWITTIAGPVSGLFRYVYGMTICLPLLIGMLSISKKKEGGEI